MLYNLLTPLVDDYGFLNLFRYLTFRTGGSVMTALVISFILGPKVINWLKAKQCGASNVREDVPEGHLVKAGTPTMGGFLILLAVSISTLLWADLRNGYVWIVLLVTMGFGTIGFVDDYLKLTKKNSKGLPGKMKLISQIAIGGTAAIWYSQITQDPMATGLALPFFKDLLVNLGWFFVPFAIFVMVGASNSVNLTDGLDGLAIVPVMIAATCFALISYLVGNSIYSGYLQLHYVPGAGELTVFCGALVGAGLGFLWFNAPPAMVFMGDTGSLSMGGALGAISIVTKHEIVLAIIGGLFVLETVSVIVQVVSFKTTGKRVFAMAPLHHHFEKKGWKEPTIVIRFWIIATILALIGLATLKLR
ncbi:phospho-N-acetylmuramoyl-pentapeptide-transferase [Aestuariispira insulae]|uniref:Phospho-N-acetylmuramoyl-pentapeptide-transferase n=1 Tax=Aestuariispira insulae TaxID=1461337 RepID=A0A3D9HXL3_9PROT|nr:phospho-N-acetylmuramoyl-pentapeptide-transferase [Aestuariispira insulae]RED54111.1 phospho-N-acetylmuramoyl-pentapeptide-transferase [Aestuariispira insulae]